MNYSIYYNGMKVVPADPRISHIYKGNTLIWQREKAVLKLNKYAFSYKGILAPRTLNTADDSPSENTFYNINGDILYTGTAQSGFYNRNLIISNTFIYQDNDRYKYYEYKDNALNYYDLSLQIDNNEANLTNQPAGVSYIVDKYEYVYSSFETLKTELLSQSPIRIRRGNAHGYNTPNYIISGIAGGGIRVISYIKDGQIFYDKGYVVIGESKDGLITANAPFVYSDNTHYYPSSITERDLNGNILNTYHQNDLTEFSPDVYYGVTKCFNPYNREFLKVGEYYLYLESNGSLYYGKTYDTKTKSDLTVTRGTIRGEYFYYNNKYYIVSNQGLYCSDDFKPYKLSSEEYIHTIDDGIYGFSSSSGGFCYVDYESGAFYYINNKSELKKINL